MGRSLALAALAALLPGAAAVHVEGHAVLRGGLVGGPAPAEPADSKTIEGPDCGHVKQIISKWSKASQVGRWAGEARGVVSSAEAAAESADAAATQVREIGDAFKDKKGDLPVGIENAATNAEAASADATAAATELDTELGTFKTAMASAKFSGAGVKDAEIVKLKELTTKARNATQFAREASKKAVKKAEEEKEEILKDSGSVSVFAKKLNSEASATYEEAKTVAQKAGYAVDDAKLLEGKAGDAIKGLSPMLKDAGDQEPVLQAFIDDLSDKKDALAEGYGNVTEAITTLETANDGLKANVTTIKEISSAVSGGGPAPATASADLTTAEEALDTVEQALADTKAKAKTLLARMDRLKTKVDEAEKKLPPPGP